MLDGCRFKHELSNKETSCFVRQGALASSGGYLKMVPA